MDKDFISFESTNKKYTSTSVSKYFTTSSKELPVNPVSKLNEELLNLYEFLQPKDEEIEIRKYLTDKIINILNSLGYNCEVFGSYSMKLFLPTSDIDIVITGNKNEETEDRKRRKQKNFKIFAILENIKSQLITEKVAENDEILNIFKAKVPLLRFTDSLFGIKVDISLSDEYFLTNNYKNNFGVEHKAFIEEYLVRFPYIRTFILILKQILKIRGLGDVKKGGLCSFGQMMLIINFINLHPLIQTELIDPLSNLSVLFMDFFQYFSFNFPYNFSISEFGYLPKISDSLISIQDPFNRDNDLGVSCTNSHQLLDVFTHLYRIMALALKEKQSTNDSLIGLWVHVSDGEALWRESSIKKWRQMNIKK